MLRIPMTKETFSKSFLDGKGNLELNTDNDAWEALWDADGQFTPDVDKIADLSVSVASGDRPIKLGEANNLDLTVSAGAEAAGGIELIWPSEKDTNELIKTYGLAPFLTADQLYLALTFNGSASAAANAGVPQGGLSATFSAGAGANAGYTHIKRYSQSEGARTILEDLFKQTRFPQRVDIPEPGEVLALTYGGYLKLGATLNWGYQLNGVKNWQPGELLDLNFSYLVKAAASMSLSYQLAGQHTLQARRGHADGWVRFVVNKKNDSTRGFAADLGVDAEVETQGLPATADEFLAALLGADVGSVVGYLKKAQSYDSLAEIQANVDSLATGFFEDLSQKWIEKSLNNSTVKEFLATAHEVVSTYESLDQRAVALYEKYAGEVSKLQEFKQKIDDLATITSHQGLLAWVEGEVPGGVKDGTAWELVTDGWGDDFYDALLDVEAFKELRNWILKIQTFLNSGIQEKVTDFVNEVKSKLGLDGLISQISKYDTAEELHAAADAKITGFVSRIVGKAFDELKGSELNRAFQKLQAFLDKIETFKDQWYAKLVAASKHSVTMQVAYNYTRTRNNESLIDLEINLGDDRGAQLARAASKGDFAAALTEYDPRVVRVNPGTRITRNLHKSSQLQVNLFGRNYSRAVEIVQNLDRYVESGDGGLVHVYSLDTEVDVKKQKFKESQHSSFLLQSVGQAVQPVGSDAPVDPQGRFLIENLRKMSVSYDMLQTDQKTKSAEMRGYLGLGHELGLVPDLEATMAQLEEEFPNGLGTVEAKYVVRFDPDDVANVFKVNNTTQHQRAARETARRVVATSLMSAPGRSMHFIAGAGYNSGQKDAFLPNSKTVAVTVPAAFRAKAGADKVYVRRGSESQLLANTLFNVEEQYMKRFNKLDDLVDRMRTQGRPVPVEELKDAAADFSKMAAKLDRFSNGDQRINVFFVIFDRLVRMSSGGRPQRQSILSLTITPPNGERVTKVFADPGTPEPAATTA